MASLNLYFKLIVLSTLLLSFSINVFSFPQFVFQEDSYSAGNINVTGQASSGTQVELYINSKYVGRQDLVVPSADILLNGPIPDIAVAIGQTLNIQNNVPDSTYRINISNGPYGVLEFGESIQYTVYEPGEIEYQNDETGTKKKITVGDQLVPFKFENVQNKLEEGANQFAFVLKYPLSTFAQTQNYQFSVNFEKYPNVISVENMTNITNQREVEVKGFVSDGSSKLYYALNVEEISNLGVLEEIPLSGNNFNVKITGLREGENTIDFVTMPQLSNNVFDGKLEKTVFVDTIAPEIEIVSASFQADGNTRNLTSADFGGELYINGKTLELIVESDAVEVVAEFNGQESTHEVINGTADISLNMAEGKNNLTLIATDEAGNIGKEAHEIHFSDTKPQIEKNSLEPEELFRSSKTAHSFFEHIDGKTNKPNVKMTVFTLPEDTEFFDDNGTSRRATCDDYKNMFVRSLGQLDNEEPDGPELNMEEMQISLLSILYQKEELTTDSDGEFSTIIGLQEKSFDSSDYNSVNYNNNFNTNNNNNYNNYNSYYNYNNNNNNNNINNDIYDDDNYDNRRNEQIQSVKSTNYVCFILEDKYGNYNVESFTVTLDAGNTMWKPGEITTIPNTMYAAEIENTGEARSANGNARFSVIARFQYIGPGQVSNIERAGFRVSMDNGGSEYSEFGRVVTSEMNYVLDTETGEAIVYFPVEIRPLGKEPIDYPENIRFAFKAAVSYSVDDKDVPIDTTNPIYFQTTINIERPLDHAKWLTPEMIDKLTAFLDTSINLTEKMVEWTGYASVAGVLTCTGAKFWYGMQVAAIEAAGGSEADKEEQKNRAKEKMFMICDRIACTASPRECSDTAEFFPLDNNKNNYDMADLEQNEFSTFVNNEDEEEVMGRVTGLRVTNEQCVAPSGEPGIIVNADIEKYEKDSFLGWVTEQESKRYLPGQCVDATFDSSGNPTGVNLMDISGVCFNPDAPQFDKTRCNFFGADPQGAPGWDPSDNIIESVRCGCITDTYSHLKNLLKIQKSIRMCLQQAKIGNTEGSYCERLMGMAVCDIATNVIFKTISQESSRKASDGTTDYHDTGFVGALQGAREGDKILNDRYAGTFYSQAGLSTEQITNKMCLVAITGDWSLLTENILSSIDQNEVEPVFGPIFPTSRLQGYNPITGDLSIMYRFTYGVVSGGQQITTRVQFLCDKNQAGGEYCPDDIINSDDGGSSFNVRTLYVSKGGTRQDTIVAVDTKAKFRYNIIRFEHSYTLKGEQKTTVQEENIFHKGEVMLANCYFTGGIMGAGAGFSCESIFTEDALSSAYEFIPEKTHLSPRHGNQRAVFYPGNTVFATVGYDIGTYDTSQTEFDLAYKAVCRGSAADSNANQYGYDTIPVDSRYGTVTVPLISGNNIQIGEVSQTQGVKYVLNLERDEMENYRNSKLIFRNTQTDRGITFVVDDINGFRNTGSLRESESITIDAGGEEIYDSEIILSAGGDVSIRIEGESRGLLAIDLTDSTGENNRKSFRTQALETINDREFSALQEGTCEMYMRILPPGAASGITFDNFEEFDSSNPEDTGIHTNVRTEQMIRKSFTVKQAPDQKDFRFELVGPSEGESVCIEGGNLKLEYVFISSSNSPEGHQLEYTVSAKRFTTRSSGTENLEISKTNVGDISVNLGDSERLREEGSVEMLLTYKLVDDSGSEVNGGSGSINFNAAFRDSCLSTRTATPPSTSQSTQSTPEDEEVFPD